MTDFFRASEKDIPLIQELAKKSWEKAYAEILSEDQITYMLNKMYSEDALKQHFRHPEYHYYLISSNDNTVGFIGIQHHIEPNTTKLQRIYLLPEAKGKGLGRESIDFLKNVCREEDISRIILNVNKKNQATLMYQKMGFSVYDEGIFDIGGGFFMDDYLMQLHL